MTYEAAAQAQGCEARATLGHRPQNIPNRNVVALTEFMLHMQPKVVMGQGIHFNEALFVRPRLWTKSQYSMFLNRAA